MANVAKKENMVISIREYQDVQGQTKKVWKTIGEIITWDDGQQSFEMWGSAGVVKGNVFAQQDQQAQQQPQQGYQAPQQGFQQQPSQDYQQAQKPQQQGFRKPQQPQYNPAAPVSDFDDDIPF